MSSLHMSLRYPAPWCSALHQTSLCPPLYYLLMEVQLTKDDVIQAVASVGSRVLPTPMYHKGLDRTIPPLLQLEAVCRASSASGAPGRNEKWAQAFLALTSAFNVVA